MSEQPCTDGQIDVYMGNYWACTCGWISDFPVGTDRSTAHNKPIPLLQSPVQELAQKILDKAQSVLHAQFEQWHDEWQTDAREALEAIETLCKEQLQKEAT